MRRKFIQAIVLGLLLPALAYAGLVGMSGARLFVQAQADASAYQYIDHPVGYVDRWVDPERTTNGACTQVDPCQWSQMMSFDPAGGRYRFILLPGQLSVTTTATDSKMPVLDPQHSGTEANPVIVTAQYTATRAGTTPEQMTVIRRTSGSGSILGTAGGADHWLWDGIKFAGGVGSAGTCEVCGGNENAVIVLRSAEGWQFTRFWIDGEQADWTEQGSTNGGGVYMQLVDEIVLRDFIIENIGDPDLSTDIWSGVEMYDATDVDVSYFTIRRVWGLCVFMKGAPAREFQRNRIHHGIADTCEDSAFHPYDVLAGPTSSNHNYWYNLIAINSFHGVTFNMRGARTHQGTHFQNITIIGSNEAVMFNPVSYGADISISNVVFSGNTLDIMWLDGPYDADPSWNYNRYPTGYSTFMNHAGGNVTYAAWRQSPFSKDLNSDQTTAVFVNAGAGDYRTSPAMTADAPDTHNLFGGGTIRRGAFEPAGVRPNQ